MERTANTAATVTEEETKSPRVIHFKAKNKQNVKWDEEVIDNENLGKK